MTSATQPCYRFDNFVVDPRSFRLLRDGSAVPVEPKALELLIFLLANRERLVTKNEILDSVWRGVFVTESALTREVALLRKTLGDDSKEPRYIETVARHGYRFIAEVSDGAAPESSAPRPALPRRISLLFVLGAAGCVVVLALAAMLMVRGRRTAPPNSRPGRGATQLTFSAGLDAYASFSPDGNAIAYSSDKSGAFQIYIRQLAGGEDVQITSDKRQNLQPAWSPDGRWIAYHSAAEGGIWLLPAAGGATRQVTKFGTRPAWSRDSQWLAFQSRDQSAIAESELGGRKESSIWTVKVSDGSLTQVTKPDQPHSASIFGHSSPTWSADGKWIAFSAGSGIWCVQPGTGRTATVFETNEAGLIYDPVFSADGTRIFYGATTGETSAVWSVAVGPGCRPGGSPQQVMEVGPHRPRFLAMSLDGRQLAYAILTTSSDLHSLRLSPGDWRPVAEPSLLIAGTQFRKTLPVFSPDGRSLAFCAARRGDAPVGPKRVWVADADGTHEHPIASLPEIGDPVWFDWLAADALLSVTQTDTGNAIWRLDVHSGKSKLLGATPERVLFARPSHDGRRVAYFKTAASGSTYISVLDLEQANEVRLTPATASVSMEMPIWSPDDHWLAVEIGERGEEQIAILPSGGGPITQLTSRGRNWPQSWSPDGKQIAFAGFRDGVWNLYAIATSTRREVQLTQYTTPATYVRYPAWSPRGTQLVFEFARTTGNLWTVPLR